MARIRSRIETEARSIGDDMVDDIRANISTPVIRGEFGGIQRSPPFEYPWLETGQLRASERYEIDSGAGFVQLNIINDTAYARRLHDGHGNVEPRPFHDLAWIEWRPRIVLRMREAILGKR